MIAVPGHFTGCLPTKNDNINSVKKIKNRIFPTHAALTVIPLNPIMAATAAIIRNVTDQRNINDF